MSFQAATEETEQNSQEDVNDGDKPQKGSTELAPSGLFPDKLVLREIMVTVKIQWEQSRISPTEP